MITEILGALLGALLVGLAGQLLVTAASNKRKYQFFKERAPGLSVISEPPRLFGGHANSVLHADRNWEVADRLFAEHGPTVGFFFNTSPLAITKDLDFIKQFALDEPEHVNRFKPNVAMEELEEDCIMFAEDEQWLRLRKAIAPAFSKHRIRSANVQTDVRNIVDKLVGLIERRLDEAAAQKAERSVEVDAEDICHRYVLALVFNNFYKQDNVIDFEAEQDEFASQIERNFRNLVGFWMRACATFAALKPFVNWLLLNFDDLGKMRTRIMDYIRVQTKIHFEAMKQYAEQLRAGRAAKTDDGEAAENVTLRDGSHFKRTLVDHVIDQYREGKLTRREYFHSTFFLFFAADKTATDGLARILYSLARHQEIQDKLRASILAEGAESEYLGWVVLESLRLFPPAPIGCSRTLKHDIQTKHGLVPAGTFVVTPARTINRLKEYWGPDSDEFRPERWADAKNFHPVQYLSFGAGRRVCPGKELALMELKMALCELMRRYKFDKSEMYPIDNSNLFKSPIFTFLVFDTPTFVKISRLETREQK